MFISRSCKETRWLKPWKALSSPKSFSKAFLKARWWWWGVFHIQFSSVAQSCPALCDPMNHSTPGLLSITNSRSSPKPMSIESVMPSTHLILCHPLLLPSILPNVRVFPMSQLFASGGQSIGASASVLPMNIQGLFPLGWAGLISLLSKGLSRVFSSTTVQKHQSFGTQPSSWFNSHICTWLLEKP